MGREVAWQAGVACPHMTAFSDIRPSERMALVAIVDADDLATLEKLRAILPEGALRPVRLPAAPLLTPRQAAILPLLATSLTNKEIARRLAISHFTVRNHVSQILRALEVSTRQEARLVIEGLAHPATS